MKRPRFQVWRTFSLVLLAAALSLSEAQDVPLQEQTQNYQSSHHRSDPSTWSEIIFSGLSTFANLPWTQCLAGFNFSRELHSSTDKQYQYDRTNNNGQRQNVVPTSLPIMKYDIAILGAPFDVLTTARPGARFGPAGIRRGSQRMSALAAWNTYTHSNSLMDWAQIVDCGDAPLTFVNSTLALAQLQQAHEIVSDRLAYSSHKEGKASVPRIVTLGGDHTTTLMALRVAYQHWGKLSVIHFDSHLDTWDPKALDGGTGGYAGLHHGTFLHMAHKEGLLTDDTNIHVGIRAPVSNKKYDWRNDRKCGFDIVTARDIDHYGIRGVIEQIKQRVGDGNVYISVDIDVLDPAYAPGTGTAEVGGWTTRELLSIIDGLDGLNIVGGDVVEVSPIYDNAGETTVLAAAEVVMSLITLMVDKPVKALVDLGGR